MEPPVQSVTSDDSNSINTYGKDSEIPVSDYPTNLSTVISRVTIDDERIPKSELRPPSAGTFNPGYTRHPKHVFGNAAAVGLSCFAGTTFVLGLYTAGAMGITIPNVIVSSCMFFGGCVQFLSGVWELAIGNTFAGTVFTSYGAFWLSYGSLFIPAFGILEAYEEDMDQFANGVGFILLGWGIYTFILMLLVLKATWPFLILFITLDLGFFLLTAAQMTGSSRCTQGGGISLTISALCGWYSCFAGISNRQNSYLLIVPLELPQYKKLNHHPKKTTEV
ncbi:Ammonia transport outward protein 2 [Spathaspora sp. JA1]|nr:Ammonia transport outward protein 2 [Spathaspora sp. JA1]